MLTKNDLKQIEGVVDRSVEKAIESSFKPIIMNGFQDFFDNFFEPHTLQSVNHHNEIVKEIKSLKAEVIESRNEASEIKEYIKDHEKRISSQEVLNPAKN